VGQSGAPGGSEKVVGAWVDGREARRGEAKRARAGGGESGGGGGGAGRAGGRVAVRVRARGCERELKIDVDS